MPTHPGQFIRRHVLQRLDVSGAELARSLRFNRVALHYVLSGRNGITPALAVRLEAFSGVPAKDWLSLQQRYDIVLAQMKAKDELAQITAYNGALLMLAEAMADEMETP